MDVAVKYCLIRSELEDHAFHLTTELFGLIGRLHRLIGTDHQNFVATQVACRKVTRELSESRHRLEAHRTDHGC